MERRDSTVLSHSCLSSSTTSMFQSGRTMSTSWIVACSRSSTTWNSVPLPGSLSTSMVPPMASMMYLVMAMPRPLPSVLRTRALSSRLKESKMRSLYSGVMPMPVSRIRM